MKHFILHKPVYLGGRRGQVVGRLQETLKSLCLSANLEFMCEKAKLSADRQVVFLEEFLFALHLLDRPD